MKSEIEKQFEEKEGEYRAKFDSEYPVFATSCMTFEECIAEIDNALKTGIPVRHNVENSFVY